MKIFIVMSHSGCIYEPAQFTKDLAAQMRYRPGMPNPEETYVRTIIVQERRSGVDRREEK